MKTSKLHPKGATTQREDKCAVQQTPLFHQVEHYASSTLNLKKAIKKRLVDVGAEVTATEGELDALGAFAAKCASTLFSNTELVKEVCGLLSYDGFEQTRSWSQERWERALHQYETNPRKPVRYSLAIKSEVLKDAGKDKPRMINADGDVGQIVASQSIAALEKFLYHPRVGLTMSIKGAPAHVTIQRAYQDMVGSQAIVEGDGSSWDFTCSVAIRSLVENTFLHAVLAAIDPVLLRDEAADTHYASQVKRVLRCFARDGSVFLLPGTRRSGHRGTSSLNWLTNIIMWLFIVSPQDGHQVFVAHEARQPEDPQLVGPNLRTRWGGKTRLKLAFEGDDSMVGFSTKIGDEQRECIEDEWAKYGFVMKLVVHDNTLPTLVEFCGTKASYVPSVEGLLLEGWTPDPPRQLIGMSHNASCEAKKCLSEGCTDAKDYPCADALRGIARHNATCPEIMHYALACARAWREDPDEDAAILLYGMYAASDARGDKVLERWYPELAADLRRFQGTSIIYPHTNLWKQGVG